MTRALIQSALDALIYHTNQTRPIERTDAAITALRAALAQPEPEPVAWVWFGSEWTPLVVAPGATAAPAPAPAAPLTDERINEIATVLFYADEPLDSMTAAFRPQWLESIARPLARAIEAHHGIGGGGK